MSNFWNGIRGQVIGGGMGLILSDVNDKRQLTMNERLLQQQAQANRDMLDYQKQKDLEMWKATNYPAQVEQMKLAGLNPGLIYGMSGGGGVTTGSSGSNVSSNNAPSGGNEVMGLMTQANIALTAAQTRKLNAEADNLEGDTANKPKTGANIDADTTSKKIITSLNELEYKYKDATQEKRISLLNAIHQKTWKEVEKLTADTTVSQETVNSQIKEYNQRVANLILDNAIGKEQKELIKAQKNAIITGLEQKWQDLQIAQQNADAATKNSNVNADNAQTQRWQQQLNAARLEWEKEMQDVKESTKLSVETIGDLVKSFIVRSGMKSGVPIGTKPAPVTGFRR